MQRSGKLPQRPPISVSLIERACGETFLPTLWPCSACAFRRPVRYKMQRLPYPPHMSRGILCACCAVPHRSRRAPSMPCRSSVNAARRMAWHRSEAPQSHRRAASHQPCRKGTRRAERCAAHAAYGITKRRLDCLFGKMQFDTLLRHAVVCCLHVGCCMGCAIRRSNVLRVAMDVIDPNSLLQPNIPTLPR